MPSASTFLSVYWRDIMFRWDNYIRYTCHWRYSKLWVPVWSKRLKYNPNTRACYYPTLLQMTALYTAAGITGPFSGHLLFDCTWYLVVHTILFLLILIFSAQKQQEQKTNKQNSKAHKTSYFQFGYCSDLIFNDHTFCHSFDMHVADT